MRLPAYGRGRLCTDAQIRPVDHTRGIETPTGWYTCCVPFRSVVAGGALWQVSLVHGRRGQKDPRKPGVSVPASMARPRSKSYRPRLGASGPTGERADSGGP